MDSCWNCGLSGHHRRACTEDVPLFHAKQVKIEIDKEHRMWKEQALKKKKFYQKLTIKGMEILPVRVLFRHMVLMYFLN